MPVLLLPEFPGSDFAWSLEDIGAYYRSYEKLMAHWSRVLPLRIHEVGYEELVHNQEAVTRKLLAYCGLEWDELSGFFQHSPRGADGQHRPGAQADFRARRLAVGSITVPIWARLLRALGRSA